MIAKIKTNIRLLQEKVEMNTEVINKNKEILRFILAMPLSETRTELFLKHFEKNLELYSKNHIFLKLQFELNRSISNHEGLKTFWKMSLS